MARMTMTQNTLTETRAEPPASSPERRIVAIMPAFNEDRFIASVILKARRYVDEVIVVDDGSRDDTPWLAEHCGARLIRQPQNMGKAAAINTGLQAAQAHGATAVILIDSDGQHDPHDIPKLLGPIEAGAADLVIGSRFLGVASNTPTWRVLGQHALNALTNVASGVSLTDTQSGYRALSARALNALTFTSHGFSVESEMQFLIRKHALIAVEVPIVVNYDEKPKRNPFKHGLQVLTGVLRLVGQHRPLLFFGAPGILLIIVGFLLGVQVISIYEQFTQLALGTALIAITLCIMGVFSIFTGVILHTIRAYMTERH